MEQRGVSVERRFTHSDERHSPSEPEEQRDEPPCSRPRTNPLGAGKGAFDLLGAVPAAAGRRARRDTCRAGEDPGCTVAEPTARITLVVVAPHSADFCPLLARAVGTSVLGTRVGMSPSRWHYADATRTCRLRLAAKPRPQITVYNSRKACRWLMAGGWVRARAQGPSQ